MQDLLRFRWRFKMTKLEISQLKLDLKKSRKSGDKLAEIVHLYLKSKKSQKELDKALLKYEKSEGWFPNDFVI